MSTSIGVRVIQLFGTLALTYFLLPEVVGEVANAAILTFTVNHFILLGVPQYIITRYKLEEGLVWHGTVVVFLAGVAAIVLALLFGGPLGSMLSIGLKSPTLVHYLPGLIGASMLTRMALIPERLLQRQMRFREVSLFRGLSEISYTVFSLVLAIVGFGGMAIVIANIARAAVLLLLLSMRVPTAQWLKPSPLSLPTLRGMMAYGLPFSVAILAGIASRSWDNLLISGMFGAAVVGVYNLAYNLADIPATQVGEQVGDVLTPSLAQLDPEARKAEMLRSTGLTSLVVFPLAVGLGVVAPTLVATLLREEWRAVGPMLTVLSALAVTRPVGWTINTYLAASDRPRALMVLSVAKVIMLLGLMAILGVYWGPLWACAGVGIGFGLNALTSIIYVSRVDGIPIIEFGRNFFVPLAATVPIVLAVLGARWALGAVGLDIKGVNLGIEVLVGAVAYLAGALVIARPFALDLIALIREASRKGSAVPPSSGKLEVRAPSA